MRRTLFALTGMVAGTTLLISLKSAPGASRTAQQVAEDAARIAALEASAAASAEPDVTPGPLPTSTAQPVPGATLIPRPTVPVPTTTTVAPRPSTTKSPPGPTGGPITGDSVFTEFGYVTVAITVSGNKITDVIAIEMPGDEARSVALSREAAPILRERALTAQSAEIDTVSGATWTSDAYRTSLQSALDKAGLG